MWLWASLLAFLNLHDFLCQVKNGNTLSALIMLFYYDHKLISLDFEPKREKCSNSECGQSSLKLLVSFTISALHGRSTKRHVICLVFTCFLEETTIMVSRAVAHSRTKKTHESHIHICRCVPQLLRLSLEVLKTPHSKAVTKPRD